LARRRRIPGSRCALLRAAPRTRCCDRIRNAARLPPPALCLPASQKTTPNHYALLCVVAYLMSRRSTCARWPLFLNGPGSLEKGPRPSIMSKDMLYGTCRGSRSALNLPSAPFSGSGLSIPFPIYVRPDPSLTPYLPPRWHPATVPYAGVLEGASSPFASCPGLVSPDATTMGPGLSSELPPAAL
jgi:hypothetical protein